MALVKNERGIVSLLTTVFIGLSLSIVTVGLMTQMVGELRQSGDAEQSHRAYYAALSGVEDAAAKISADIASGTRHSQGCAGNSNLNLDPASPGVVGWTCQKISYSTSPQGSLNTLGQAVQIDTAGAPAFKSVVLEWDLASAPYPAGYFDALPTLPAKNAWNHAALIETTFIEYPNTPFSAVAGAIKTSNALVRPTVGGSYTYNYDSVLGNNSMSGRCDAAAGSYHCKVIFSNFQATKSYAFRLRTYYVGTDYKMTFMSGVNGGGSIVEVPDGNATIDVTAKSGAAYRRVVYKVPFSDRAAGGLNYVIYSGSDICKNFDVFDAHDVTSGCPYF